VVVVFRGLTRTKLFKTFDKPALPTKIFLRDEDRAWAATVNGRPLQVHVAKK